MKTCKAAIPRLKDLSQEEKLAQMFMIDFGGLTLDEETLAHFKNIPWGGVILFAKNISSREQTLELNRSLQKMDTPIPLIISLDQEGGIVNRVSFDDMSLSPGNLALGETKNPALTGKMAEISGQELRELGFNLNFAPVADVNINPQNPIIGSRSFGDDPMRAAEMVKAAVLGYQKAGIGACAKHFPGHGDTSLDSHLMMPLVDAPMERLKSVELYPFNEAIKCGVSSIMTAHVVFPALTGSGTLPATLSRSILTDLLKKKMGYQGMVITDSMAMKAIADNYSPEEAAILTINAGADMVMMLGHKETQKTAYYGALSALKKGLISEERINEGAEAVLNFKRNYIENPPPPLVMPLFERKREVRRITAETIKVLYDKGNISREDLKNTIVLSPLSLYRTMLEENDLRASIYLHLKERFSSIKRIVYNSPLPHEAFNNLYKTNFDTAVIEIFSRGCMPKETTKFWEDNIHKIQESGGKVILVSLLNPYGLPQNADLSITGFNYSPLTLELIAEKLTKMLNS